MNPPVDRRSFLKTTTTATAAAVTLAASAPSRLLAADGKVTLAFVGCAHIHTPGFINLLKGRPDVTVKYVWDHLPARAEKRGAELGAKVVSDLNEVWNDASVSGVVICSETNRHPALVKAASAAKKHQFIEKPLGITAAESVAMAKAIENAGLLFTTGYFMRTDPKHLFLKEQVAAGAFGTITRASAWNCHSGSLGGWFDEKPNDPSNSWRWMADVEQAGVGGFGDLGTHSLDILMWLLGDVESVSADVQTVTARYEDGRDRSGADEVQERRARVADGRLAGRGESGDADDQRHRRPCLDRERQAVFPEQEGAVGEGQRAVDPAPDTSSRAAASVRGCGGRQRGSTPGEALRGCGPGGGDGGDV
jgi:predicted dehydrogenase